MPFSSDRRPTKRACGGSSGSPTPRGSVDSARDHANVACAELARGLQRAPPTGRARRERDGRASAPTQRARRASSTSVPQSWSTNGFRVFTRGQRRGEPVRVDEIRVARGSPRGTRVRREEQRHERAPSTDGACRFPTMPCPYASPKCRNEAGETTSTSTPAARRCSTASRTNAPATSSGPRGYDVVRTTTFIRAARAPPREARPRASRTRRSSRRSS